MNEKDFDNLVEGVKNLEKSREESYRLAAVLSSPLLILKPYVRKCINPNPNSPS